MKGTHLQEVDVVSNYGLCGWFYCRTSYSTSPHTLLLWRREDAMLACTVNYQRSPPDSTILCKYSRVYYEATFI